MDGVVIMGCIARERGEGALETVATRLAGIYLLWCGQWFNCYDKQTVDRQLQGRWQ